jgi:hypothetical protein
MLVDTTCELFLFFLVVCAVFCVMLILYIWGGVADDA